MNISFSTARRLGIWTLLAIVIVGAFFAVTSLRRVVKEINQKVEMAEVKERQFNQILDKAVKEDRYEEDGQAKEVEARTTPKQRKPDGSTK